jgi:hypothetical protein
MTGAANDQLRLRNQRARSGREAICAILANADDR